MSRRARPAAPRKRPGAVNQVRIIAGDWRGRKLSFPDAEGLRPSGDRLRETLFNWLQPWIEGSHCLDLFAGSGALGFEAASRGAARVVMVERESRVARALRENADRLAAGSRVEVVESSAQAYLTGSVEAFDLVFLDPPFQERLLPAVCAQLAGAGRFRPGLAWAYLEMPANEDKPVLPPSWGLYRQSRQGEVRAELYRVE